MENDKLIFEDSNTFTPFSNDQPSSVIFVGNPSAKEDERRWLKGLAKWDTGATMCSITKEMSDLLGLKPVKMRKICSFGCPQGEDRPEDTVLLKLTNGPYSILAQATIIETILPGFDVIIGMNVISAGKFSLNVEKGRIDIRFEISPDYMYLTKLEDWPGI